jgi:alcohol dehydrogenase
MLPHVVRWNADHVEARYVRLVRSVRLQPDPDSPIDAADRLVGRLEELRRAGGLPTTLREIGVPRDSLPALAADAAKQWTGTFNPRPFDAAAALELYEEAY